MLDHGRRPPKFGGGLLRDGLYRPLVDRVLAALRGLPRRSSVLNAERKWLLADQISGNLASEHRYSESLSPQRRYRACWHPSLIEQRSSDIASLNRLHFRFSVDFSTIPAVSSKSTHEFDLEAYVLPNQRTVIGVEKHGG